MKPTTESRAIEYPDDDGKPMADNSLQFEWIQLLSSNLAGLFHDRADVVVGGNLLWYPVEGFPKIRRAPDTFVIFGRPKGYRGSYKQWEEDNVPMTVVFEVRSPNDSDRLMRKKLKFYDTYGVEEYCMVDPERYVVQAYRRLADMLAPQRLVDGAYTSPRLGIGFEVGQDQVRVFFPDGRPFLAAEEKETERATLQADRDRAEQRVETAQRQAETAQRQAQRRVETVEQHIVRLADLSRRVRHGEATAEDLAELDRLLEQGPPA